MIAVECAKSLKHTVGKVMRGTVCVTDKSFSLAQPAQCDRNIDVFLRTCDPDYRARAISALRHSCWTAAISRLALATWLTLPASEGCRQC